MLDYSTFLFARPSAIEGVARMFDLGNTLSMYNYSTNAEQADERALRMDLHAVANDLKYVIENRAREQQKQTQAVR